MTTTATDVLITRIVDREDRPDDWCELEQRARADDRIWPELCAALRDDAALRAAVRPAIERAAAAAVGAATAVRAVRAGRAGRAAPTTPWTGRRPAAWIGWLVAAVIAGLWLAAPRPPVRAPAELPGTAPRLTATAAAAAGDPTVVRELPRVVLETRPLARGEGLEVFYLRRVLERAVVPELYELTEDDRGIPVSAPVSLARFEAATRF